MSGLKSSLLRVLASPGAAGLFRRLLGNRASILMLHRFEHPERGVKGHDVSLLRSVLERLRGEHFDLLPLDTLIERLAEGRAVQGAVAFTIDDGYADHAEVAAPVFAEFDCPATTFVVSGFLDGALWLWWDQVEYVFERTRLRELSFMPGGTEMRRTWTDRESLRATQLEVIERLKLVPDVERVAAVQAISRLLDVELPPIPPGRYAPMSWDQLRQAEKAGMRFGPHTVTHPVLSRTDDAQSLHEIGESWRRLKHEAVSPQAVFCYPNGGFTDFGTRETATLRQLGFQGAVVGAQGYATAGTIGEGDARFRVRRFPFSEDLPHVWQYVTGLERAKQLLMRRGS